MPAHYKLHHYRYYLALLQRRAAALEQWLSRLQRKHRAQAEAQVNGCQVESLLLRKTQNLLQLEQSIIQRIAVIRTAQVG